MRSRILTGFIAGFLGAVILVIIMFTLKATGFEDPGFVGMYRSTFGAHPPLDQVIAALLFSISGGIWGLIFAILVRYPTIFKGILFGLLPTLWLWVVLNAYFGKPMFNGFTAKGLLMPVVFNMLIWGSFVGWYTYKRRSVLNRLNIT